MGMAQDCKSKTYKESKALILQSLRDIITQEEWEKEKSQKTNTNCVTVKDPLKNVQNKLKEQLLEEKWAVENKICAAKINLKKAKNRREEVGRRLNIICKKFDHQCNCLDRVSRQHQLMVSSCTKVKEAFNIQQSLYDEAVQNKSIVVGQIEKAEIEMKRLGKDLMKICSQWGGQVEFRKELDFAQKRNKSIKRITCLGNFHNLHTITTRKSFTKAQL